MTMATITRVSWADVTLAEYAALDIIRREDAGAWLDRYWDNLATLDPFHDGPATRLSEAGAAWLATLQETCWETLDERELIASARDFVRSMGTMLTMNVHRMIRGM